VQGQDTPDVSRRAPVRWRIAVLVQNGGRALAKLNPPKTAD
jgi:hypothetical protein